MQKTKILLTGLFAVVMLGTYQNCSNDGGELNFINNGSQPKNEDKEPEKLGASLTYEAIQEGDSLVLNVKLDQALTADTPIGWQLIATDSAKDAIIGGPQDGQIIIVAGQDSGSITLPTWSDGFDGADSTFSFSLTSELLNIDYQDEVIVGESTFFLPFVGNGSEDHSCVIFGLNGHCFGANGNDELGRGNSGGNYSSPQVLSEQGQNTEGNLAFDNDFAATAVAVGYQHSCLIADNKLYCMGARGDRYFTGTSTDDPSFEQVAGDNTSVIKQVSAGTAHTCALVDGAMYCWGANDNNKLGGGSRSAPVSNMDSGVSFITSGTQHNCAVKEGQAFCWGAPNNNRLGGSSTATPVSIGDNDTIVAIKAGRQHTCAVNDLGELYCWGSDGNGRLGTADVADGSTTATARKINVSGKVTGLALGLGHTCAIIESSSIQCWGRNDLGQLGLGDQNQRSLPTVVANGLPADKKILAIGAGDHHTCAVVGNTLTDTQTLCWGRDNAAQLGDGSFSGGDFRTVPAPTEPAPAI